MEKFFYQGKEISAERNQAYKMNIYVNYGTVLDSDITIIEDENGYRYKRNIPMERNLGSSLMIFSLM